MVVTRGHCLKAAQINHVAMFEIDSRLATLQTRPRVQITGMCIVNRVCVYVCIRACVCACM